MSQQLRLRPIDAAGQAGLMDEQLPRPCISLRLLGGFELRVGGASLSLPGSTRRLVALLALRGRSGRSRLAGELWPETTETRALGCLRTSMWRVNQAAPGLITSSAETVDLDATTDVDVRRLLDASQIVLSDESIPSDPHLVMQGGALLPDWEEEWLAADRERLRQLHLHALEAQAERLLRAASFGLALEWALAAVRVEPLRESAHRTVIRIHLAEGNVAEARRSYEQCVDLFSRELDMHPSHLTSALLS